MVNRMYNTIATITTGMITVRHSPVMLGVFTGVLTTLPWIWVRGRGHINCSNLPANGRFILLAWMPKFCKDSTSWQAPLLAPDLPVVMGSSLFLFAMA
jgi:hypothetical protein